MNLFRKALGVSVAFAAIALSPREARADKTFHIISPGFLWGVTKQLNDAPTWGALGGELTYTYIFEHRGNFIGAGAFCQVQTVGFHHLRAAVGPQIAFWFAGLELGPYIETAKDTYATTFGLHASPFVTLGVFSVAFRAGIPIAPASGENRYGVDLGAVFTLKLPFAPGEEVGYIPILWFFAARP
jgi:hypothetical protein